MTQHIARVLGLDPPTHYHRAFSSVGICGAAGPHALEPTCGACRVLLWMEDAPTGTLETVADAIEAEIEKRLGIEADNAVTVASQSPLNTWNAVPLPPDVAAKLEQPIPSGRCLDGSTEACVPAMPFGYDVPRCVHCRRELR